MKDDIQKLLSKADADKFAIYAKNISKDEDDDKVYVDEKISKLVGSFVFC